MLNQNSTIPLRTGKRSNKTEDRTERMEGKYQSSIGNGINENL